jgi:hypothetical protein
MGKCTILFGEEKLVSLLKQQKLDKPLSIAMYSAATTLTGYPLFTEGFGAGADHPARVHRLQVRGPRFSDRVLR